jgi:LuxR family maltose regulon positive regulatory protein
MANLPTGTLTFLFSDIEGSSQLWEHYPAAMQPALARHDTILSQAIALQMGVVFKTVGDGYHAVFQRAIDAVRAALDAQHALCTEAWDTFGLPSPEWLRVRMAIHTGVAELRDDDYFGTALNRVARLMDAGHGGQVLLSRAAADLVYDLLPPGVTLRDLGEYQLKNLSHPERIFLLLASDLPIPLTPLRATPIQAATQSTALPPLLKTKLAVPPARASLVERQRLMSRIALGMQRKLTLICAPAGFGKTTLLSAWRASSAGRDIPVAWVSLDDGDNDPTRFWTYITAALDSLSAGASVNAQALLRSPQPPPIEVILTELINALATVSRDVLLVLDDYHVIATPAIHTALTFLLDHLPPQLHVVIASRTDPLLPLARWRARGDLLELRAADLRFTADEAAAFLRDVMGLDLASEIVAALEARTEGWIAGLQLAALSLQGMDDVDDFIKAFTGSHRHIADYLSEEVLQRQPAHVKAFLLQTSILDRLCGQLCDAVLGLQPDERPMTKDERVPVSTASFQPSSFVPRPSSDSYSRLILEELERAHLFLVALDHERQWYRYHHLFADVLRYQLTHDQPHRVAALHQRAATWYERHGFLQEAAAHLLAAGVSEGAARLVERLGPLQALARGESMTVQRWLDALPDAAIRTRPVLCLARARLLQRSAPASTVEQWLQDAERILAADSWVAPAGGDSAATIRGEIAALRAHMATAAGNTQRAIEQCRIALAHLPAEDVFARATLYLMLGNALDGQGEWDAAGEAYAEARILGRASGNMRATLMSLCNQGLTHVARGQLATAAGLYREAMNLGNGPNGQPLPAAQAAYRLLADILREWNDLAGAEECLVQAVAIAEQHQLLAVLPMTYSLLARVQQSRGATTSALRTLARAQELARTHRLARDAPVLAAKEAEAQLWQGNLAAAVGWADSCDTRRDGADRLGRPRYEDIPLIYARVRIAQGKPEVALARLNGPMVAAEQAGQVDQTIECLVIQTLAYVAKVDLVRARDALARALTLAESGGYIRVFVDAGAPVAGLLAQRAARSGPDDPAGAYIERLLAAFPEEQRVEIGYALNAPPALPTVLPRSSALAEPLTERETEVLRLLAAGMSSAEIAQHFIVSINTVKTQIKSVYGKLDAHSRDEAIAKARTLRLIH